MSTYAPRRLRLLVQLGAMALVVAVPWLLNRHLVADTLVAQAWVTHTAEVKNLVNEAQSTWRDADRSLLWLALNPDDTTVRQQLAMTRTAIESRLVELERLVADNPDQRARAAQVRALVETRTAEADRVLGRIELGDVEGARALLVSPVVMTQLRTVSNEIAVEEDLLLDERRDVATARRDRVLWLTTLIGAVQLALLGLIVGLSERQHGQRRRLEVQTREAQQWSGLILDAVRKPIALLDRELRILTCNPAFQALYAEGESDLVGRDLTEVGHGVWKDAALQLKLRDVCDLGRELWDHEFEQAVEAAGNRILLINARRMPGTTAATAKLILTANDITASRGAERHIRELNEQLGSRVREISESNRELEAFSYSVSHDLRAPLRHIAAFSDKLEHELAIPRASKAGHYLSVIGESARRMGLLIDQLLVHSKLGRTQFRATPVAMAALVDEVRATLAHELENRDVDWQIGPLPTVRGDVSMLRLIWQNLLGNAVKYTARRDRAVIRIAAHRDDERGETIFSVGDNGAGFDMAYSDKLFGVFQRLHTADEFAGTGIGLANVKRIVGRHGGRVWARAEPDKGAEFFFSLPDRPVITSGDVVS